MKHFTRSHIHLFFIALILFVITLGATSVNARSAIQTSQIHLPLQVLLVRERMG